MNNAKIIVSVLCLMSFVFMPVAFSKPETIAWEEITETDWSVSGDSLYEGHSAVMIFEKILADDKKMEKKKCYRTIYRRIRILGYEGRKQADVEAPFFYLDQEIELVKGRTILRDGTIIELQKSQIIEKEVIKTKKNKYKQLSFSIPGVSDDCIIEYILLYRLRRNPHIWTVQKDIPLILGEMRWKFGRFKAPKFLADFLVSLVTPNYLWLNHYSRPSIKHIPNLKEATELLFRIDNVPAFETEPYTLPEASLRTRLICYYGSIDPPSTYWGGRGTTIANRLTRFSKKNKKLKKVLKSFESLQTNREKIAAAYRWVQENLINTDYVDVTKIDKSGKKKEIKLREHKSIDDIIKRGYADKEMIHFVFCDMLREMGIDAKLSYLKSRINGMFEEKAKYSQFNESMVAVVDELKNYEFYAPGFPYLNIGEIPWYCEGVKALVTNADDIFVTVTFSKATDNVTSYKYQFDISDELEIRGQQSASYGGHQARKMRMEVLNKDTADFQAILLEEFEEDQSNAERSGFEFKNLTKQQENLELSCEVEFPSLSVMGSRLILKPFDYMSEAINPFHATDRMRPLLFDYAFQLSEEAIFTLPKGWQVDALPDSKEYENQAGSCRVSISYSANILSVHREFVLIQPFWGVDAYSLVKDLFQQRQNMSGSSIILSKATSVSETN
ncbi:MAG: DUF3857 domain-containing protein [candidate division Zixibacteria bacterium]|nr:DUF3857 domain-containing protein [candidate division Zixibacteria bacterium]